MANQICGGRDGATITRPPNLPPQRDRFKEVTIRVSRIANGYQVTELADNIPFAYFELGLELRLSGDEDAPPTTVAEHLARFFDRLEAQHG